MTDPIVAVEPLQLQAEPGGQALTVLTVRNQGQIVDGFRVTVLGAGPPAWARVEPEELRILPGEEASATVIFSPPAGSRSVSGNYPFGILVSSTVNPTTSAAAEGDLKVGSIEQLQSRLSPVSSTGRWRSRHIFEVTNWGNSPVRLRVVASDQDNQLGFLLVPSTLDVPIGGTGVSQLQVRTRHPRLRGAITRLPFQVTAAPEESDTELAPPSPLGAPGTAKVDGAFSQRPILSKLVVGLLALVLVAGAGAIALALRSTPQTSTAANASGAPNTPDLTVTAVDSQSLKLKWSSQPNLKSYSLVEVTPDGAFLRPTALDPVQTEAVVNELQPNSTHCYRLQAVRGDLSSVYSDAKCATTQSAPITATPTSGSATTGPAASTSSGSATQASTAASSTATSSPPSSRPGGGGGGVALPGGPVVVPGSVFGPTAASTAKPGTPTPTPTSTPATTVVSTSPPTSSPTSSSPTVSATVSSTVPTTAQPEGVFTPTQFIAVYGIGFLPPDAANMAKARQVAATLPAGTLKPGVVDSSKYSHFAVGSTVVVMPTLYIYAGPFNTSGDAQTFCDQHVSDWFQGCLVAHPGALAGN